MLRDSNNIETHSELQFVDADSTGFYSMRVLRTNNGKSLFIVGRDRFGRNIVDSSVAKAYSLEEREAYLAVSMIGVFDESGTDLTGPTVVIAGLVCPAGAWGAFRLEWAHAIKEDPPIHYFRMAEAAGRREQFGLIPKEFRNYKLRRLAKLVDGLPGMIYCAQMEVKDYNEVVRPTAPGVSPYAVVFHQLVYRLCLELSPDPYCERIKFVFDDDERGQGAEGRHGAQASTAWTP